MANTTADKLAKLEATKSAMKTAINGSGNLVGDVFADYPGAVDDFRSKVATAITEKGVPTAATDTPDQMASNIGSIETGGGFSELLNLGKAETVGSGWAKNYVFNFSAPSSGWSKFILLYYSSETSWFSIYDNSGNVLYGSTSFKATISGNDVYLSAVPAEVGDVVPYGYVIFAL